MSYVTSQAVSMVSYDADRIRFNFSYKGNIYFTPTSMPNDSNFNWRSPTEKYREERSIGSLNIITFVITARFQVPT